MIFSHLILVLTTVAAVSFIFILLKLIQFIIFLVFILLFIFLIKTRSVPTQGQNDEAAILK